MFWQKDSMEINAAGHLMIGGCDCVELAAKHGTPLYVMDEATIRRQCRAYTQAANKLPMPVQFYYASKALSNLAIVALVCQEGFGVDVVSYGELITATNAGVPRNKILMHGNNKTRAEIAAAFDYGIGGVVLDGETDLMLVQQYAHERKQPINVYLRLRPGIDAHTHSAIQTAVIDCKFGFGLQDGAAMRAAKQVAADEYLQLAGIHCHIGSQIFDPQPYETSVDTLCAFLAEIAGETGQWPPVINLGGGVGARYTQDDDPMPIESFIQNIGQYVVAASRKHGLPKLPTIAFEPGRSIVAEAGVTLYTVGAIKQIPGIRTYVSVDGGMADNPRVALYDAKYTALLANRADQPADGVYTIAGRCCETGDVLIYDAPLPKPAMDDLVAVMTTGAYNASMASQYNRLQPPAMVLVRKGRSQVIQRRPSPIELLQYDQLPPDSFYR